MLHYLKLKDKYQIIALFSILLSIGKLITAIYQYLDGPSNYNPNILYLFMLPEYWFYMPDWINYSILLLAGILIFYKREISYIFYNVFFICILSSFIIDLDSLFYFSIDNLLKTIIVIMSIIGLYFFNKEKTKNELNIKRGLRVFTLIFIGIIYLVLIYIPIMFC
jgi:hypothetical protein